MTEKAEAQEVEEVQEIEESTEPKSRHDVIRELADAADKPEEEAPSRERDDKGRFAKASEAEPSDPPPPEEPEAEVPSEDKPKDRPAPAGWSPAAKEKWAGIDEVVQKEVEKREQDIHKGIEQYKEKAKAFDEFSSVVSPYMATIQAQGVTPTQAVQKLLGADHLLRTAPPAQRKQVFLQLANHYGVEIEAQEEEAGDPVVSQLQNELYSLKQQVQAYQQESQRASFTPYVNEVEKFRANPANEHFETLRPVMAALIESGAAADLQSAYDQALYANPDLRGLQIAKQQEKAKAEERKRIEAAKRASVQVKGAPSSTGAKVNAGDRRATIEAAMDTLDR